MPVTRFEELLVWQKSRELAVAVYRASSSGPFAGDFALKDQVRRAAISVMSNIAEGFERYSRVEFRHFLSIARGSVSEVRSQLHLARSLDYLDDHEFDRLYALCLDITRMSAAFHRSLRA